MHMHLLLGEGGVLLSDYQAICPVTIWPATPRHVIGPLADKVLGKLGLWPSFHNRQQKAHQQAIQTQLELDSVDLVLVNTVTSGRWFRQLPIPDKTPVVTFVHELDMSVQDLHPPDELAYLLQRTTQLLAVSKATARYYEQQHGMLIRPA